MRFSTFAVGFLITIIVFLVAGIVGFIFGDDDTEKGFFAWIFSSIGFGISLTILLIQNGIIN